MKVLIAVLHCDRKAHNQLNCLQSIYNQDYPDYEVYHNIETTDKASFKPLLDYCAARDRITHFDFWNYESSWWKKPAFDQDQARLVPICEGRNRAIECAVEINADYLLFVDADMRVPANTITQLMARDKDMVGGYVKGRNDHKDAVYVFGGINGIKYLPDDLIECDHGNIGFVLIKRKVFEVLRFRRGRHCVLGHLQSDDPNYCFDWYDIWNGQRFYIDQKVKAEHIDDTVLPFNNGAQF